ncbi:MAG TPA: FtsX-like permease family protein [Rhizomicrobium sp.]|jgi:putative ABC transport system permease protein|nr:FtsX-like permease family protein [Rhizomicrobium sp.]
MRFLPLIWAAVMRKPVRTILTLLSVMVAFTLFGITIGMNATFDKVAAGAHDDRIFTNQRFFGTGMPLAQSGQTAQLPGIAQVAYFDVLSGYHENQRNRAFALMVSDNYGKLYPDWPITPAEWDMLHKARDGVLVSRIQAEHWHLKPGDIFTIVSPQNKRADGKAWDLKVLAVVPDLAYMTGGFMVGNYEYFNKALPLGKQDKISQILTQVSDPSQTAAIAQQIDNHFANSATSTLSTTEKAALDISSNGLDLATLDRKIALAGMFMVLFLTANGIAQSVRERLAEFATLKTIGFTDRSVVLLVFMEAALPCLLGAALGVVLAAVLSSQLPRLFPPGQGTPPLPTMTAMVFVWAAVCASAVALVSAALPALRLKRMDIATALSGRAT